MAASDERYAFLAEWYDSRAALMRKYQLLFYPNDRSVEMYDIKNRRLFLKRSLIDGLELHHLFIGAIINIHSRQLTITDYADQRTSNLLRNKNEKTLAMIKPDAVSQMVLEITVSHWTLSDKILKMSGQFHVMIGHDDRTPHQHTLSYLLQGGIIDMIHQEGFHICEAKMVRLSSELAAKFYAEHQGKPFFSYLLEFVTSGPVVAMELKGANAIDKWRTLLGPTDSATARNEAPLSVRAKFGTDNTKNAAHGSDSSKSAEREIDFFFGGRTFNGKNTATFLDCTLCVIKPHAIIEGLTGKIISAITSKGFEISALQMFHLERANSEEFLEVYKGVVDEYKSMVEELCCGSCLAMEIRSQGDAPIAFRDFVGPPDPEIARHLRPGTLRAMFGNDKIKNSVHCTDLPEDGLLEVQYFFKVLDH